MIEQQIDRYLDQQDELYAILVAGEQFEWERKPAIAKAFIKIRSFIKDVICDKDKSTPKEDLPF